jgi:hypothetical protein
VILRFQGDTMPRPQFTIFAEDAQEYAAVFTSSRRLFGKQKMGTGSRDHNKNAEKSRKIFPVSLTAARAGHTCRSAPDPAVLLSSGGFHWQSSFLS